MKFETAISLIEKAIVQTNRPQHWMDLGAGTGLFTTALASLLPSQSSILSIDKDEKALKSIKLKTGISLQIKVQDFTIIESHQQCDGILMANALHYVQHASVFLSKLKGMLKPDGQLIIVEYERRNANAWVPYPIDFKNLESIGNSVGFNSISKLVEVPSIYDAATIYSAMLR
jgi:2-polyprenyl-3-methyl-5-hydroxy-6-metoxy-1,4-benzoquinol methylase